MRERRGKGGAVVVGRVAVLVAVLVLRAAPSTAAPTRSLPLAGVKQDVADDVALLLHTNNQDQGQGQGAYDVGSDLRLLGHEGKAGQEGEDGKGAGEAGGEEGEAGGEEEQAVREVVEPPHHTHAHRGHRAHRHSHHTAPRLEEEEEEARYRHPRRRGAVNLNIAVSGAGVAHVSNPTTNPTTNPTNLAVNTTHPHPQPPNTPNHQPHHHHHQPRDDNGVPDDVNDEPDDNALPAALDSDSETDGDDTTLMRIGGRAYLVDKRDKERFEDKRPDESDGGLFVSDEDAAKARRQAKAEEANECHVVRVKEHCFTFSCDVPEWLLQERESECRMVVNKVHGHPDDQFPMTKTFSKEQLNMALEATHILQHTFENLEGGSEYRAEMVCATSRGQQTFLDRTLDQPFRAITLNNKTQALPACPVEGPADGQETTPDRLTRAWFVNKAPGEVLLYKLQPNGEEHAYMTIREGEVKEVRTYQTHRWRVRMEHNKRLLLDQQITGKDTTMIVEDCAKLAQLCHEKTYIYQEGFFESGTALHYDRALTIAQAKEYCCLSEKCYGFTFQAESNLTKSAVKVWFKRKGARFQPEPHAHWHTYVKNVTTADPVDTDVTAGYYGMGDMRSAHANDKDKDKDKDNAVHNSAEGKVEEPVVHSPLRGLTISDAVSEDEGGFPNFNPDIETHREAGGHRAVAQSVLVAATASSVTLTFDELEEGGNVVVGSETLSKGQSTAPIAVGAQPVLVDLVVNDVAKGISIVFPLVLQRDELPAADSADVRALSSAAVRDLLETFVAVAGDHGTVSVLGLTEIFTHHGLPADDAALLASTLSPAAHDFVGLRDVARATDLGVVALLSGASEGQEARLGLRFARGLLEDKGVRGREVPLPVRVLREIEAMGMPQAQAAIVLRAICRAVGGTEGSGNDNGNHDQAGGFNNNTDHSNRECKYALKQFPGIAHLLPDTVCLQGLLRGVATGLLPPSTNPRARFHLSLASSLFLLLDVDGNDVLSVHETAGAQRVLGGGAVGRFVAKALLRSTPDPVELGDVVTIARLGVFRECELGTRYAVGKCVGTFDVAREWMGGEDLEEEEEEEEGGEDLGEPMADPAGVPSQQGDEGDAMRDQSQQPNPNHGDDDNNDGNQGAAADADTDAHEELSQFTGATQTFASDPTAHLSLLRSTVPSSALAAVLEGRGWDKPMASFVARDVAASATVSPLAAEYAGESVPVPLAAESAVATEGAGGGDGQIPLWAMIDACRANLVPVYGVMASCPRDEGSVSAMLSALAYKYEEGGPLSPEALRTTLQPFLSRSLSPLLPPPSEWPLAVLQQAAALQYPGASDSMGVHAVVRAVLLVGMDGVAEKGGWESVADDWPWLADTLVAFHKMDTSYRGSIAVSELADQLHVGALNSDDSLLVASGIDVNRDGQVDFLEFGSARWVGLTPHWGNISTTAIAATVSHIKHVFHVMDLNHNKRISEDELYGPLVASGLGPNEAAAVVTSVRHMESNVALTIDRFLAAVVSGVLPIQKLEVLYEDRVEPSSAISLLRDAFARIDTNNEGRVHRKRLTSHLQRTLEVSAIHADLLVTAALRVEPMAEGDDDSARWVDLYEFSVAVASGLVPLQRPGGVGAKAGKRFLVSALKVSNTGTELTRFDPSGVVPYEVVLRRDQDTCDITPVTTEEGVHVLVNTEQVEPKQPSSPLQVSPKHPTALFVSATSSDGSTGMRFVVLVHQFVATV